MDRASDLRTHHGFVCANAGVDARTSRRRSVCLLPVDPDASAAAAARRSRGRPRRRGPRGDLRLLRAAWRHGITDVAIGVGRHGPVADYRDIVILTLPDGGERPCRRRRARRRRELVMGKTDGIPSPWCEDTPTRRPQETPEKLLMPPRGIVSVARRLRRLVSTLRLRLRLSARRLAPLGSISACCFGSWSDVCFLTRSWDLGTIGPC